MEGKMIRIGGGLALLGVALGAFGAHALKETLIANEAMDTWKTASFYHLIHAVAILLPVSHLGKWKPTWFFVAGILLFSGSLYLLALLKWTWLGPVTPLGGVSFMAGWACLIWSAERGTTQKQEITA